MITVKSYHSDSVIQRELGLDVYPGGEVLVPTRVTKVGEVVSTNLSILYTHVTLMLHTQTYMYIMYQAGCGFDFKY